MKVTAFVAAASLAQTVLAFTIPSRHQKIHAEADRRADSPAVETVTNTFYQTVVWVDSNGKPLSTEINTPPAVAHVASPVAPPAAPSGPPKKRPGRPSGASKPSQPPSIQPPSIQPPPAASQAVPIASSSALSGHPSNVQTRSEDAQPSGNTSDGENTGNSQGGNVPAGSGICYDMIDSQTKCKDPGTINTDFSFLKGQGYSMIRIYDIGCPVGDFTAAAAQNGLKLMVGINAIANLQGDLGKLIDMVGSDWSAVDTVYIGNELVNTGAASASQVAGAVSTARGTLSGAGFSGSVITVDTFNVMMNDPTVCSTSDYCGANAHAFFDPNTSADKAGAFVLNAYNKVAAANSGKTIIITESGWPYQGNANGQAVPSSENQKTAMDSIRSAGIPGSVFFFQAYNAGYKAPGNLGVEQYFGVYGH